MLVENIEFKVTKNNMHSSNDSIIKKGTYKNITTDLREAMPSTIYSQFNFCGW